MAHMMYVEQFAAQYKVVGMVGDGINEPPHGLRFAIKMGADMDLEQPMWL